jgi:hypothetical protein
MAWQGTHHEFGMDHTQDQKYDEKLNKENFCNLYSYQQIMKQSRFENWFFGCKQIKINNLLSYKIVSEKKYRCKCIQQ